MPSIHPPVLLPSGRGQGFGGAVFLGLFAVLALMACFKYLALHSTISSLGLTLSALHSIHAGGEWWRAFTDQARPLLLLYAQVYRLVPDQAAPLVLLTLQAFFLALPVLPTARRYGMLAALAYALYFPIWFNAVNGLSAEHLLVPILFGFLLAARSERYGLATVLAVLPALVSDYNALTTMCCGLYLYAAEGRHRAGFGLLCAGGLYLYLAAYWLIPFCTAGVAPGLNLPLHPGWPGSGALAALAACGGALLFLPLARPKMLLPALPSLGLLLCGPAAGDWTGPATAGLAGVLFFAFCEVLGPVRVLASHSGIGGRRFGLIVFLSLALIHVLLSPSPVSRLFLTGQSFAYGVAAYEPSARDATILAEILRFVPDDDNIAVVAQNTLDWGALAERRHFGGFPRGVFEPETMRDLSGVTWRDVLAYVRSGQTEVPPVVQWTARYVLLDTTRPWAVLGRTCAMAGGVCRDGDLAREYTTLLARVRQEMDAVYDQGGFLILARRPAPVPPAPAPAPEPPIPVPQ